MKTTATANDSIELDAAERIEQYAPLLGEAFRDLHESFNRRRQEAARHGGRPRVEEFANYGSRSQINLVVAGFLAACGLGDLLGDVQSISAGQRQVLPTTLTNLSQQIRARVARADAIRRKPVERARREYEGDQTDWLPPGVRETVRHDHGLRPNAARVANNAKNRLSDHMDPLNAA